MNDPIQFSSSYGEWGFLHNFYRASVEYKLDNISVRFPTSEHLYQALKFLPHHKEEFVNLARFYNAKDAKNYVYLNKNKWNPNWENEKVKMMEMVIRLKISQYYWMIEKLRSSGNRIIQETRKTDYFWGIGANGTGKNYLGKIWMKIREELRNEPD